MADKLLTLLTKLAIGKWVILFLFLVIAINAFVLPVIYPRFETLDMQSSYSPEQAYQLIASYGEEGRQYYTLIELTLDVVYPLLSALMFISLTIFLFRRVFPPGSFWQKLPLLGPIVMVVDYLENTAIVTMLLNYPRRLDLLAQAANMFTVAKFGLSQLELILIVIGLVSWLGKAVYARVRQDRRRIDPKKS
ncbi:MAG: hypothetical protein EHM40_06520 [Chloroflexi bacterium]|nr:MAG: hypothetical protein EHM40_06520 [Chloroflexota bacterium]